MKSLNFVILLTVALITNSILCEAQEGGPPPMARPTQPILADTKKSPELTRKPTPPQIDKTWIKYVSEQGHFQIHFPAQPTVEAEEAETAAGKLKMWRAKSSSRSVDYSVLYMDLPAIVSDPEEVKIRYAGVRDNSLRRGNKLLEEKDFSLGNLLGKQLVFDIGNVLIASRLIIVGDRHFQANVIFTTFDSSGKVIGEDQRKLYESFFDTFKISYQPLPRSATMKMPEDFGVMIDGQKFSSAYLGLSLDFPNHWYVASSKQATAVKEGGKQNIPNVSPGADQYLGYSYDEKRMRMLTIAQRKAEALEKPAILIIAAGKLDFPTVTAEMLAKNVRQNQLDSFQKEFVSEVKIANLGGIGFGYYDSKSVAQRSCRTYLTVRNQVYLEISYCFDRPERAVEIEEILQKITFH